MRRTRLLPFIVAAVVLASDARGQELDGDGATEGLTRGCGADCVLYCSSRAGLSDVTRSRVEALVDPDQDGRCSIAELVHGFNEIGFRATPRRSVEKRLPDEFAVLLVRTTHSSSRPDHFVVLERDRLGERDDALIFVPQIGLARLATPKLTDLWDGDFIELRTSPVARLTVTQATLIVVVLGAILGFCAYLLRRRRTP